MRNEKVDSLKQAIFLLHYPKRNLSNICKPIIGEKIIKSNAATAIIVKINPFITTLGYLPK